MGLKFTSYRGIAQVVWIAVGILALTPFQNCGNAFEALKLSEFTSSSSIVAPPEQAKAMAVLSANCKACHVDQALGNLTNIYNVDHLIRKNMIKVGKPDESPLYIRVNDGTMPPSGPLTSEDKLALRNWILALGGETPVDPTPVDVTFVFKVNVDPLPFRTRLGKVNSLVGPNNLQCLAKLESDRLFLGDYDYSQAIIPKFSWESTDMRAWLEAVEPVCGSSDVRNRFPFPSGNANFIQAAYGRAPSSLENTIANEIAATNFSAQEKFDIFCMSILSSLEYVAK